MYRHYLLGRSVPVRVTLSQDNRKMGAEVPDPATGSLRLANTYMSRIAESWEVEEITAQEFARHCAEIYERHRAAKGSSLPEM
jgi:hypothetical protein